MRDGFAVTVCALWPDCEGNSQWRLSGVEFDRGLACAFGDETACPIPNRSFHWSARVGEHREESTVLDGEIREVVNEREKMLNHRLRHLDHHQHLHHYWD